LTELQGVDWIKKKNHMSEPVSRRGFIKTTATGIVGAASTLPNVLDVHAFDAVGDGKTDNTTAIQKALNRAAEIKGTVFIPEGVFACSTLKVPPFVGLCGNPSWGYSDYAGAVLQLCNASAPCLIDITGASGARINGLCLNGAGLGKGIHGIRLDKPDYGKHEDAICIERCRIGNFTGDGVHLSRIWVFSIRHCMICFNGANGLCYRGWDGFIMDNWFSANAQAGIGAYEENASCTFTANRIEWNGRYGMILQGGNHYNITGNYFDRTSGPALAVIPRSTRRSKAVTITGNIIYRSGAPHGGAFADKYQSAHLRFEGIEGLTCVGNTCDVGKDDGGEGETTPDYSMVLRALTNSVVANNAMHQGALKALIVDLGGHGDGFILKDNPGSLFKAPV
jgi:hypothetical protein